MQCNLVPVNTAPAGEQARFTMMPWVYHPLLAGPQNHPVTHGINYVRSEFASSLDTVGAGHAEMIQNGFACYLDQPAGNGMFLSTLVWRRLRSSPILHFIHLPDFRLVSFWRGALSPFIKTIRSLKEYSRKIISRSVIARSYTSVFVVTDGDIPANEVQFEEGAFRAQPLGYDKYTRQTFGNSEFIMNVINYMTDKTGIMELRSREFKLRLLEQGSAVIRSHRF